MTKSDVEQAQKKAQKQAENTSGGGHLGGTYYGQEPDAKTASTVKKKGDKAGRNDVRKQGGRN
ncbi:hypothetical protein PYH37_001279 [Sinorhizobium numidicum]|uniref:DUF3606 domain-containing protein n=1 Tax=Sinorhizobium numidicum TaxID=680248 RepID=A0ABY8CR48_9HYPH|nr:hypothetical protein [Sinorhizobium numidicum]WEX73922.1 hypothetical protein PYH37_001279 [Sinorhizobium numidicum]WEX79907.1 hypothetical protein PYH38_001280 [Sinorhizobium numidicum]